MPKIVTSTNTNVIQNVSSQLANGTVGAPSLAFSSSNTTGLYRLGADSLGFAAAGVAVGNISATGAWALGPSAGATAQTHTIQSGSDITVELKSFGTSGITNNLRLISGSTSGNSNIQFYNGATLKASIIADNLNTHSFGADSLVFRQATTNVGAVTTTGAWTLGAASGAQTHIIRSNGNTQIQADSSGVLVRGRTDGAAIAAGYVGETLSSSATNVTPGANGVAKTLASRSLTAGVWLVTGYMLWSRGDAAGNTYAIGALSGDQNTVTSGPFWVGYDQHEVQDTGVSGFSPTNIIVNTTGTTIYINGQVNYVSNTTGVWVSAKINAVRIA